jgi:DNA-binding GntR family transcriptional regulator
MILMNEQESLIIPVRDQIFNKIKQRLLSNQYQPGDIIPIDRVAKEFSVSATPIREAFIRLESSGFLKLIPNKGAKVPEITERDIENTWDMRKLLEPYAGKLTAKLSLKKEIEILKLDIKFIIDDDYNHESYMKADNDLHQLLFRYVDNSLLKDTLTKIHEMSMRMRYHAENSAKNSGDVINQVCREHMMILDALSRNDAEGTEQAVLNHIMNGKTRTINSVLAGDSK